MVFRRFLVWAPAVVFAGLSACTDDSSTDTGRDDAGIDRPDGEEEDGEETDEDAGDGEGGRPEAEVRDAVDTFDGYCTGDENCWDDLWCNGQEECEDHACITGPDPCNDRVDCSVDSCDEDTDRCFHTPDDSMCQDELACNGEEQCTLGTPGVGCSAGTRPDCRDESPCTFDSCQEEEGGCVHVPRDLDEDTFVTRDYGCDEPPYNGTDCNDSDAEINPDAEEICDNIRDDDCDTLADFADDACRPPNDTCARPVALEEGVALNSSTRGTMRDYSISCGGVWDGGDVAFSVTIDERRDVIVAVEPRLGGSIYAELERTCGDSTSSLRCSGTYPISLRRNGLEAGTYYVVVQANESDFTITFTTAEPTPIPPNDVCTGATDVPAEGGTVPGTLVDCRNDYVPTCGGSTAYPDVFYRLVLTEPKKVTISAQLTPASWSTYMAVMTTCGDRTTEIGCASGTTPTFTRNFLDTGTYYIAVDADMEYPFNLTVRLEDPIYPPANDRCSGAVDVSGGGYFVGTLVDTYRDYPPSCSTASLTGDVVYTFTTEAPQDVTIAVTPLGADVQYVAALRAVCDDRASEIGCRSGNPAQFTRRSLAAGTYFVIVSGPATGAGNRFLLQVTIAEPTPVPPNDVCTGAIEVSAGGTFTGSTAACLDDYTPTCLGATNYFDIVYSLTLDEPADVTLDLSAAGGAVNSFLDLRHGACGLGSSSLRCVSGTAPHIFSRNVAAGSYWILVETQSEASTVLEVETGPPTTACDGAEVIDVTYPGGTTTFTTTVSGTTGGRPNDFTPGCRTSSTASDVPYQINIPVRSTFYAEVTSSGWDTVLHMRSRCDDPGTELACDDDGGSCSLCSRIPSSGTLTLDPGSYYMLMDGYSSASGPYTVQVNTTSL